MSNAMSPSMPVSAKPSADIIQFPAAGRPLPERSVRPIDRAGLALSLDEVWQAIEDRRITMHYQPQFDLVTGQIRGAESLVRLVDRDGQLIYPDRFIDRLEASDLIVPFGRVVIETVCRDLADLRQAGSPVPQLAINLSAYQLNTDLSLLRVVEKNLQRFGLDHSALEFELTERQQLKRGDTGSVILQALADKGSSISLDDFGAGYASIMSVVDLPLSALKLDRALVARLPDSPSVRSVVSSVLELAQRLDLEVIAEGIEQGAQHRWLREAGCRVGQGFLLARPMTCRRLHNKVLSADDTSSASVGMH